MCFFADHMIPHLISCVVEQIMSLSANGLKLHLTLTFDAKRFNSVTVVIGLLFDTFHVQISFLRYATSCVRTICFQ